MFMPDDADFNLVLLDKYLESRACSAFARPMSASFGRRMKRSDFFPLPMSALRRDLASPSSPDSGMGKSFVAFRDSSSPSPVSSSPPTSSCPFESHRISSSSPSLNTSTKSLFARSSSTRWGSIPLRSFSLGDDKFQSEDDLSEIHDDDDDSLCTISDAESMFLNVDKRKRRRQKRERNAKEEDNYEMLRQFAFSNSSKENLKVNDLPKEKRLNTCIYTNARNEVKYVVKSNVTDDDERLEFLDFHALTSSGKVTKFPDIWLDPESSAPSSADEPLATNSVVEGNGDPKGGVSLCRTSQSSFNSPNFSEPCPSTILLDSSDDDVFDINYIAKPPALFKDPLLETKKPKFSLERTSASGQKIDDKLEESGSTNESVAHKEVLTICSESVHGEIYKNVDSAENQRVDKRRISKVLKKNRNVLRPPRGNLRQDSAFRSWDRLGADDRVSVEAAGGTADAAKHDTFEARLVDYCHPSALVTIRFLPRSMTSLQLKDLLDFAGRNVVRRIRLEKVDDFSTARVTFIDRERAILAVSLLDGCVLRSNDPPLTCFMQS